MRPVPIDTTRVPSIVPTIRHGISSRESDHQFQVEIAASKSKSRRHFASTPIVWGARGVPTRPNRKCFPYRGGIAGNLDTRSGENHTRRAGRIGSRGKTSSGSCCHLRGRDAHDLRVRRARPEVNTCVHETKEGSNQLMSRRDFRRNDSDGNRHVSRTILEPNHAQW